MTDQSRRDFLRKAALGAAASLGAAGFARAARAVGQEVSPAGMPARPLGLTGHNVRLFSLGGQSTLERGGTEQASHAIIHRALDLGVNYIDTAAWYGDGQSERYIGAVMAERRGEAFLATKTHDRSYDGSMHLLERSLKNLQTDRIDLWQVHNVRTEDDLKQIFAPDGAIKALEEARAGGVVRFLGITGHFDPFVLRKGIQEYPFDAILMALNAADRHQKSFIDHLLPAAVEKKLAIVGMKVPARGRIFREGGIEGMEQAMRYVLTLPVSTVIIGITGIDELEENVRIATGFTPMTHREMEQTERLTHQYFAEASWFKKSW